MAQAVSKSQGQGELVRIGLAPRGLSRLQAAAYLGISPSLFDDMVRDGRMPGPKRLSARTVWDRRQLDAAFEALPNEGARRLEEDDEWSNVRV